MNARFIHNDESSSFRHPSAAAEEREPGTPPSSVVCSDAERSPGSRLRYVAERGSGRAGTVYNRLDWEVLDREAPAGHQVICRARRRHALAIAKALNRYDSTIRA